MGCIIICSLSLADGLEFTDIADPVAGTAERLSGHLGNLMLVTLVLILLSLLRLPVCFS